MRSTRLLLVGIAALALWPSAATATWPGKPGKLAYWTLTGLHTIGPTGKHHRRLEKNGATYGIAWSRSGKELAFSDGSVWRTRADGSHRKLVRSPQGIATI